MKLAGPWLAGLRAGASTALARSDSTRCKVYERRTPSIPFHNTVTILEPARGPGAWASVCLGCRKVTRRSK